MEGFDNRHFLVGIIVGRAEDHTEAGRSGNFFDAFHHITPEWISNRRHHQAYRARTPPLQTLCNGIRRIAHLMCQNERFVLIVKVPNARLALAKDHRRQTPAVGRESQLFHVRVRIPSRGPFPAPRHRARIYVEHTRDHLVSAVAPDCQSASVGREEELRGGDVGHLEAA